MKTEITPAVTFSHGRLNEPTAGHQDQRREGEQADQAGAAEEELLRADLRERQHQALRF